MMILPFVFFFAMATPNERTLSSYELATQEYVQGTATEVSGSFKKWIDATLALLSEEAEIFEIGSGFGRDAKYMESYGFHVERSDATEAFIALMQTEGYAALYFNVITDTFPSTYDLIFANAVFLHLTPQELALVLNKVHQSLKPRGLLAFSVKKGEGEEWTNAKLGKPRYFCYWSKEKLKSLLKQASFQDIRIAEDDVFLQVIARP